MEHDYVIETNRLQLRQIEAYDLKYILSWRNHNEIRRWFFNAKVITDDEQLVWYKNYLNNDKDIMFFIEETANINAPIGTVALYNIDIQKKRAEFGRFMIGNFEARGKGIGLECVNAVCKFGFDDLGLENIYLEVLENNVNAANVYKKAGFRTTNYHIENNMGVLEMELHCCNCI